MSGRVEGKVAIITGAAGGLGLAGARRLGHEGAKVLMIDLSPRVHDLAEEIMGEGIDVTAHVGDVSAEADVAAAVALARDTYGRVDVLWNNAGLVGADWIMQDTNVLELDFDYLKRAFEVNTGGMFLGCKHAVPVMAESGGGSIINTSSIQSLGGDLVLAAYGITKAAINYLSLSVATSFGHQRIRCNAIAPGLIPPPASTDALERAPAHRLEAISAVSMVVDNQMLPDVGEQGDIANLVLFLASDESKFITGQVLNIDGGISGHVPMLADRRRSQR